MTKSRSAHGVAPSSNPLWHFRLQALGDKLIRRFVKNFFKHAPVRQRNCEIDRLENISARGEHILDVQVINERSFKYQGVLSVRQRTNIRGIY
jgi:hypothetical protein